MSKLLLSLAILGAFCFVQPASAQSNVNPTFNRTRTMIGSYLWVSTLAEYDYWESAYPGSVSPFEIEFRSNGDAHIYDGLTGQSMVGVYTRNARNQITVYLPLPGHPYFTYIEYRLYRQRGAWWGEMAPDGNVMGHLRANLL